MKNRIFVYTFIIIFILISISLGVVFAVNKNSADSNQVEIKIEEEIDFLEEKIISMANKLNNISFFNAVLKEEKNENISSNTNEQSDSSKGNEQSGQKSESDSSDSNSQNNSASASSSENIKFEIENDGVFTNPNQPIDWEYLSNNISMIYTIMPTIIIDLNSLNIKNDDILNFSSTLDQVTLSIKKQDKVVALNNLAALYAYLPTYRENILNDSTENNIDFCKNCILNGYSFVEQNDWQEAQNQIGNAVNYYANVMDSINTKVESQNRISKAYILLNELNNSVALQDKELFYIKYRNVMEELMNL